jgi:hypothetical protein
MSIQATLVRKWRAMRHLHPDGTRHNWKTLSESDSMQLGLPTHHICMYDYCSCYRQRCTVCHLIRTVSDGVDEIR